MGTLYFCRSVKSYVYLNQYPEHPVTNMLAISGGMTPTSIQCMNLKSSIITDL